MFNKKISIILITLVFMLSLSAVAAADVCDDMTVGEVEEEPPSTSEMLLVNESDVVSASENDDVAAAAEEEPVATSDNYVLTSDNANVYYKTGDKYQVTLTKGDNPVEGVKVSISVAGSTYSSTTNSKGVASLPINLKVGSYKIISSYEDVKTTNTLKVLPVIKAKDLVVPYAANKKFTATFLDKGGKALANTEVKFDVAGKTYTRKTNSKGVASLPIGLKAGEYVIKSTHPNGYQISNLITVLSSVTASKLIKYYGGSQRFSASFVGNNGKPLVNKKVKFQTLGKEYTATTNSKGVAYLPINANPGLFTVTSVNPVTGDKCYQYVKVLPTVTGDNIDTFVDVKKTLKITLRDTKGKILPGKIVKIKANGKTYSVKTNAYGLAKLAVKYPTKGTKGIVVEDTVTGCKVMKYAFVKAPTLKAESMTVLQKTTYQFKVKMTDQNGKAVSGGKVQITYNGVTKTVKTDSKGIASVSFNLKKGTYYFKSKDLSNGYSISTKVSVKDKSEMITYNKYGISSDGKTLLTIGRPSAYGELSKYGYKFYITKLLRECPYCHSHDLYWGIFWAGSETRNYGYFPGTGLMEGGSAEGHVFCACCDSDWSVFGINHGGTGGNLKVLSPSKLTTKEEAYKLLKGNYIYIP